MPGTWFSSTPSAPYYAGYWADLVRSLDQLDQRSFDIPRTPLTLVEAGDLRPLGLLAVDNVLSHADELVDFRRLVDSTQEVAAALVPIGAGVLLITKEPAAAALDT